MSREIIEVFITKYALTQGIIIKEVEIEDDREYACVIDVRPVESYSKKDYTLTIEEARKQALILRNKKIASLKKQLLKMEAMNFNK